MSKAEVNLAKSVCFLCPVRVECLLDAVQREDYWGVQGGLTGPERSRAVQMFSDRATLAVLHNQNQLEQRVVNRRGR